MCPRSLFADTIKVSTKAIILTHTPGVHTVRTVRLLSGNYKETIAGRWLDVSPSILVCRPGRPHTTRYGFRPPSCFVFEVLPDALRKLRRVVSGLRLIRIDAKRGDNFLQADFRSHH